MVRKRDRDPERRHDVVPTDPSPARPAARDEDALIAAYIEQDPHRPGLEEARLIDFGVPVWALVGYSFAVERPAQVAEDYDLPEAAVKAALAYYRRHRLLIEARLAANAVPLTQPSVADFYLDNDLPLRMVALLQAAGHTAVPARALGLAAAPDYDQLLAAAQRNAALLTHNARTSRCCMAHGGDGAGNGA